MTSTAQHSTYGRCVMQCMCLNQPTLVLVSIIRQEYSDLRTRQRQTQQPPTLPPPLLMALGTQAYPRNPQLLVSPFTQSPPQSSTDLGWPPDKPVRSCPPYGSFLLLCLTFPCLSSFFFFPPVAYTSSERPQALRLQRQDAILFPAAESKWPVHPVDRVQ